MTFEEFDNFCELMGCVLVSKREEIFHKMSDGAARLSKNNFAMFAQGVTLEPMDLEEDPEFRADQTDTEPDVYDTKSNRFV